jgi:hypothetical protein
MLERERPDLSLTSSTSTSSTRVIVAREDGHLRVDVWSLGAPRVSRSIAIEDDREKPALRVVALIAAEAIPRPEMTAPPVSPPLVERSGPPLMWISLGLESELWLLPVVLHPGLSASALFRLTDELYAGLRVHLNGVVCCELDAAELAGDAEVYGFAISGRYVLGGDFSALVSAGVSFVSFRGLAKYENAVESANDGVEGDLRAALAYETPPLLAGARFTVALGAHARLGRLTFNASGAAGDGVDIDPGILAPFAELGVSFSGF